ncbi:hypothetical protein [Endozoicomonas sp.]|uniref:hypothetical protein n=1 Tax=Endozoicomonas sp. TaxID=1892382 RepID=UPI003AF430F1
MATPISETGLLSRTYDSGAILPPDTELRHRIRTVEGQAFLPKQSAIPFHTQSSLLDKLVNSVGGSDSTEKMETLVMLSQRVTIPSSCLEAARETHNLLREMQETFETRKIQSDELNHIEMCLFQKIKYYKLLGTHELAKDIESTLRKANHELIQMQSWLLKNQLDPEELASDNIDEDENQQLSKALLSDREKPTLSQEEINTELIRRMKRTQLVVAFSPEVCQSTVIREFSDFLFQSADYDDLFIQCYEQCLSLMNNPDTFNERLKTWTSYESTADRVETKKLLEVLEIAPFAHNKVAYNFDKMASKLVSTLAHTANVISGKATPFANYNEEFQENVLTTASRFAQVLSRHSFLMDSKKTSTGVSFWTSKVDSYIDGLVSQINQVTRTRTEYDIDKGRSRRLLDLSARPLWDLFLDMPDLLDNTLRECLPTEESDKSPSSKKGLTADAFNKFAEAMVNKSLAVFDQAITDFTHHLLFQHGFDGPGLLLDIELKNAWSQALDALLLTWSNQLENKQVQSTTILDSHHLLLRANNKLAYRKMLLNWITALNTQLTKELYGGAEDILYKPCLRKLLQDVTQQLAGLKSPEGETPSKACVRAVFTKALTRLPSFIAEVGHEEFSKLLEPFKKRAPLLEPETQEMRRGRDPDPEAGEAGIPLLHLREESSEQTIKQLAPPQAHLHQRRAHSEGTVSLTAPPPAPPKKVNSENTVVQMPLPSTPLSSNGWRDDHQVMELLKLLFCLYKPAKVPDNADEHPFDPEDIYDAMYLKVQTMTTPEVERLYNRGWKTCIKDYFLHPVTLWQFQQGTSRLESTLAPNESVDVKGNTAATRERMQCVNLLTMGAIQMAKEKLCKSFPDHALKLSVIIDKKIEKTGTSLPSGIVLVDIFCDIISIIASDQDESKVHDLKYSIRKAYQSHLKDFQRMVTEHSVRGGLKPSPETGSPVIIKWDQCLLGFQDKNCNFKKIHEVLSSNTISFSLASNAMLVLEILTDAHIKTLNTYLGKSLPPTKELVTLQMEVFALGMAISDEKNPADFKEYEICFETFNQFVSSYAEEQADLMNKAYGSHDEMMDELNETFMKTQRISQAKAIHKLLEELSHADGRTVELINQFNRQVVELSKTPFWKEYFGRKSSFQIYGKMLIDLIDEHQAFLPGLFFGTTLASLLLSKEGNTLLKAVQSKLGSAFTTLLGMQGTMQQLEAANKSFHSLLMMAVPSPGNMTFDQFQQHGQCYSSFAELNIGTPAYNGSSTTNTSLFDSYSTALNQTRDALSVVRHTPDRAPLNGTCPIGGNPKFPTGDVHIPNSIAAGFSISTSLLAAFPWVREIWKKIHMQGQYSSLASLTQELTTENAENLMVKFYEIKHGEKVTAETLHEHQDHGRWMERILEGMDILLHRPPPKLNGPCDVLTNMLVGALRYPFGALSMLTKQRPHSVDQHYSRNSMSMVAQAGKTGMRLGPQNISKEGIAVRNPSTSSHLAFLFFIKECDVWIALPEKAQHANRHISEKQLKVFIKSMQNIITRPEMTTKFSIASLKETYGEKMVNDIIPPGTNLQTLEKEVQMQYKAYAFRAIGSIATAFAFGANLAGTWMFTMRAWWSASSLVNNVTASGAASIANMSDEDFDTVLEEYRSVARESIDPFNISESDQFWFLLYAIRTVTKEAQINLLIAAKAAILIGMYCNIRGQSLNMGISNRDLRALVLTALTLIKDTVSGRVVRAAMLSKDQDFLTVATLWDRFDSIAVEFGYSKATKNTFTPPQELVSFTMSEIQETLLEEDGDVEKSHAKLSQTFKEVKQVGLKPLCKIAERVNDAVNTQIVECSPDQSKTNSPGYSIQDLARQVFTDLSTGSESTPGRVSHGFTPDEATQEQIDILDEYIASDCEHADLHNPVRLLGVIDDIKERFTPEIVEALIEQRVFKLLRWGEPKERLQKTLTKLDEAKAFFAMQHRVDNTAPPPPPPAHSEPAVIRV